MKLLRASGWTRVAEDPQTRRPHTAAGSYEPPSIKGEDKRRKVRLSLSGMVVPVPAFGTQALTDAFMRVKNANERNHEAASAGYADPHH
jgi:hypothetical protein